MDETALDRTHAAMQAAPEDAGARMAFYHALADSALVLLLERPPEGDRIIPRVFEVDGQSYALAFDSEHRLAAFAPEGAPYAALPGRVLAGMLAPQAVGLGLNLDVAPSSILIPPEAIHWLVETLDTPEPDRLDVRAEALLPPGALPQALLTALDGKLARMGGLAAGAYLAGMRMAGGGEGHLLAFVDAAPGAQDALARAIAEALVFSGMEAGALDVGFVAAADPVSARLARVGLRFDLPQQPERAAPAPPGMDPDRPPILR